MAQAYGSFSLQKPSQLEAPGAKRTATDVIDRQSTSGFAAQKLVMSKRKQGSVVMKVVIAASSFDDDNTWRKKVCTDGRRLYKEALSGQSSALDSLSHHGHRGY
jgi:hypothetical protein